MPNRRLSASVVLNSVLVRKLTWSAASDGIALTIRNSAISAMAAMIIAPAAIAIEWKMVSPRRLVPPLRDDRGWWFGRHGGDLLRSAVGSSQVDEPTAVGVWCQCHCEVYQEIALMAVVSSALNASGIGM